MKSFANFKIMIQMIIHIRIWGTIMIVLLITIIQVAWTNKNKKKILVKY